MGEIGGYHENTTDCIGGLREIPLDQCCQARDKPCIATLRVSLSPPLCENEAEARIPHCLSVRVPSHVP